MKQEIEVAFSPCPNDTFIFHHLLETGSERYTYRPVFADVEELNRLAIEEGRHRITKLSFHAMALVQNSYRVLDCGGALGRGCGPLWIGHRPESLSDATKRLKRILIPGRYTTANLLLQLYLKEAGLGSDSIEFVPVRYDAILPAIRAREADYGLLIHEERFTYEREGLFRILDLGEWWEKSTGLPIPLGCIAARRDLSDELVREVEDGIRRSIRHGFAHPAKALPFIKEHSQSLQDEVVEAHIGLYVNDYSLGYGEEGHAAIRELFRRVGQQAS